MGQIKYSNSIENDEEFCRAFIVFSFATLLAPYYRVEGHHGIWPSPIETISEEVNWAQFILDGLMSAIHYFQLNRGAYIRGCLMFLQIKN